MAKIRTRQTSEMGASIKPVRTGEDRKSRTVLKSFMDWAEPPAMRYRLALKMAVKTRPLMRLSKASEASCRISERTHSSTSISA